jgi:hypothetical protein
MKYARNTAIMSNPTNLPANGLQAAALPPPHSSYAQRNEQYWQRNLAVCVFGSFTTLVSLSMLLPFLPLYVEQLGVSSPAAVVQWSGVAFGATFFGTAITAPVWGLSPTGTAASRCS